LLFQKQNVFKSLRKKEVQVHQKLFLKKERWMPLRQQILSSAV
jgi:hypothetical protein